MLDNVCARVLDSDAMEYVDFHVKIGPRLAENRYAVSVRSALGEANGVFTPPLGDVELENLVLRVGLARRSVRQIKSQQWRAAQQFGQSLFRAMLAEELLAGFVASRADAEKQRKGMRIKLTLDSSAPELANYPWEFLYDPSSAQFLSLLETTPLVRYVELPRQILPFSVTPPLRILGMISSPRDYPELDVERERTNLENALRDLRQGGLIELDWVTPATLDALRNQLLKQQYHVFHFIGHGGFDERAEDGILVLEDERKQSRHISAERVAYLFGDHSSLRLALLNACEGARQGRQDPFAGTAMTLVRTGNLPAVVAMQFEITDQAATDFASGFYSAIAVGRSVDAAVTHGRKAVFARDNDVEWSTAVLYLRAADGRIFDVDVASANAKRAEEQLKRERAEQERLERERVAQERAQQRAAYLNDVIQKGRQALEDGDPFKAAGLLGSVTWEDPTLQSVVNPLLESANQEIELSRKRADERAAQERADQERLERERIAREQRAREKLEAERATQAQAEQQRLAREKVEREMLARAPRDAARAEFASAPQESQELSLSSQPVAQSLQTLYRSHRRFWTPLLIAESVWVLLSAIFGGLGFLASVFVSVGLALVIISAVYWWSRTTLPATEHRILLFGLGGGFIVQFVAGVLFGELIFRSVYQTLESSLPDKEAVILAMGLNAAVFAIFGGAVGVAIIVWRLRLREGSQSSPVLPVAPKRNLAERPPSAQEKISIPAQQSKTEIGVALTASARAIGSPTRLAVYLGLVVFCFAIANALAGAQELSQYFIQREYFNADFGTFALLPAIAIAGALGGWLLSLALATGAGRLSRQHVLMLVAGWGAAFFLTALFGTPKDASDVSEALMTESAVTGVIGGLTTAFVLWQSGIVGRWQWLVGIVAALVVGFAFSFLFRDIYFGVWDAIKYSFSEDTYQMEIVRVGIWQFIFGSIGALAGVAALFVYLASRPVSA